jgi:hypothetical protein
MESKRDSIAFQCALQITLLHIRIPYSVCAIPESPSQDGVMRKISCNMGREWATGGGGGGLPPGIDDKNSRYLGSRPM